MELKRAPDASSRPSAVKRDTVGWYLDHIKSHEVLPHEKLVELFQRRESGDVRATNEIVEKNLKLVISVARAYKDKGVSWEDLIQEGNLGLYHAVEKFEWRRGNRFSTYALWWIRQRISHHLATHRHDIRVPTHALRLRKHIDEAFSKLAKEGVSDPSWDAVARVVGSSADVVEATCHGAKPMYSLSQPPTQSERDALEARFNEDGFTSIEEPEPCFASKELRKVVLEAVAALDPLDRRIAELRMTIASDGSNGPRLAVVDDIAETLNGEGTSITVNAVRTRLRFSMLTLAEKACDALGVDADDDELDRLSRSRHFHEAVASFFSEG